MSEIYNYRQGQPVVWFHKDLSRSNKHCLYCGRNIGPGSEIPSNKEHLIGREFVPKGSLGNHGSFNFIFRSCVECNTEKSEIERHISTITLTNSPDLQNANYREIAQRKFENDFYPGSGGTRVSDIRNEKKIIFEAGSFSMSFCLVSPSQIHTGYSKILAYRHMQGLFSLINSTDPTASHTTRLLPAEHFHHFGTYFYSDWGNPVLAELSKRANPLPCNLAITTASGYFRAIMRASQDGSGWFWALEWNKSYRLLGWIGDADKPPPLFLNLPEENWHTMQSKAGEVMRVRSEIPVIEEADILFVDT
ncbi:MAG: hypothetical protein GVY13_11355 [Alphaproteobacteria bacterium]|jgi:hypothetical protein|nr:hypothetical protein [Alphaproteobacteria bacterium]